MPHIGPLGLPEILIILVVILIIFGPKNLPKLGTAVGKAVKNLREGIGGKKKVEEVKDDQEEVYEVIDKPEPASKPKPASAESAAEEGPKPAKPKPVSSADEDEQQA